MSLATSAEKTPEYKPDQEAQEFDEDLSSDESQSTSSKALRHAPPRIRMMLTNFRHQFSHSFDVFYYIRRREQRLPYEPEIALTMVRYLGEMYINHRAIPDFLKQLSLNHEMENYQLKIKYDDRFKSLFPKLGLESYEPLEIRSWIKPHAQVLDAEVRINEHIGNVMIIYQLENRVRLMLNIHLIQDKYLRTPDAYWRYLTSTTLRQAQELVSRNSLLITTLSQGNPFFAKSGAIPTSFGSSFMVPNPEHKNLSQFEFFCRGIFAKSRFQRLSTQTDSTEKVFREDPDYIALQKLIDELMSPFTQHPSLRIFRSSPEISRDISLKYSKICRFLADYVQRTTEILAKAALTTSPAAPENS